LTGLAVPLTQPYRLLSHSLCRALAPPPR